MHQRHSPLRLSVPRGRPRSGEFTSPRGGVKPPLRDPGYRVTYLPVDREGLSNLADLEAAITDQTAVVSLMWANNETGVLFPVEGIAEICRSRGVLYHCDAVQAAGKVEIDVRKIPADYLSLTGHKFHAPKGIGARSPSWKASPGYRLTSWVGLGETPTRMAS